MSLDNFKSFVKQRPNLANSVVNGDTSWQKLYELYELYGSDSSVWDRYLSPSKTVTLKDILDSLKNIDVTEIQNSITSLQKGILYIEDLIKSKESKLPIINSNYEPRPIYKYFDD